MASPFKGSKTADLILFRLFPFGPISGGARRTPLSGVHAQPELDGAVKREPADRPTTTFQHRSIVSGICGFHRLGQLKVAPWIPFHLIIGIRHGSNVKRSSDGIVAYSSSHLDGAESELDVKTGHTVTHSPKTEEEVLRILKLNLRHPGSLSDTLDARRPVMKSLP